MSVLIATISAILCAAPHDTKTVANAEVFWGKDTGVSSVTFDSCTPVPGQFSPLQQWQYGSWNQSVLKPFSGAAVPNSSAKQVPIPQGNLIVQRGNGSSGRRRARGEFRKKRMSEGLACRPRVPASIIRHRAKGKSLHF